MREAAAQPQVDIADVRVGMYIHLQGGWLAHPFPLSSFKLTSAEQIATLRSLGVARIAWSPEKSDLPDPAAAPNAAPAVATAEAAAAAARLAAEAAARRAHREALAAQRAALQLCERQFAEAAKACRGVSELVQARPRAAAEQAGTLARALLDKMLAQGDTCIRLLSEGAGDKASTHAVNVTLLSLLLGRAFGVAEAELLDLGVGALLHDVGKLDLPERIRVRDEHFSAAEASAYQQHVAHGVAQARRMGLAAGAARVIAQHHEHADGSGFPQRMAGDSMAVGARIVALVNRYDNLCNPGVPAKALTPHEALSLLFAQGRTRYDGAILGGFVKLMGVYPPGSAVQLTDERYALVVAVNSARPLKPRVLVHDRGVAAGEALLLDLETQPALGIRRSVKPQALPRDTLDYLSPRPRMAYFFEPARQAAQEASPA